MSRNEGVTERQLQHLADFERSDAFSPVEKAVLRYAEAMTRTPVDVTDEIFQAVREHFTPAQMVELTSAIAWENYRARFDHAFGIESEGFAEGAACAVPAMRAEHASAERQLMTGRVGSRT